MKNDQGNDVAESENDFDGMLIVWIEHFKEGVKRVWATKQSGSMTSFYMIYAADKFTKHLKENEVFKLKS